jgi:sugar lactone lactonase YvrE
LYWADKGGNSIQAKIAVMNMDGSQPRTINKRRVEVPEGLAIDRSNNDLYWSDSGKGWVSDYVQGSQYFSSVPVFYY